MTISEERIVELGQQYLYKLQRANVIDFATFKPGLGKDRYDFLDGLWEECYHLADCLKIGYQNKEVEADLESALDVANIKVGRESKEYKLLIHTFLVAAEEACCEKLSMYKGKYDFKLELTKLATEEPLVKNRVRTIAIQKEVNKIAKEIMVDYPTIPKYNLAKDIADKLVEEDKILNPPKKEAIRKKYLTKYPKF